MPIRPLLASLLLALAAAGAAAEDVKLYRAQDTVDPREVASILDKAPKMRSLRLLDDGAPQQVAAGAPAADDPAPGDKPSALALPVQFAFDSADILASARAQLDALVDGIKLLPPTRTVRIEGHTDATGSDDYNERLSWRRAQAVKHYLVAKGIEAARLHAVGLGESVPLAGRDPKAADQRRVQFSGQ
jgi:outer membrane protein OmpA-like peptidoglycan-associated protein